MTLSPSAIGRILFWRGGSLWIGLAGAPAGLHTHHAVQIALPFSPGRVRFQAPGASWADYEAAIIAAEQPHAFDGSGQLMAQVFVEPESRDGRDLQARYRDQGVAHLHTPTLCADVAALAAAYRRRASDEELIELARLTIDKITGIEPTRALPTDARVMEAIELIRARLDESISLDSLAAAVHLSPDRFRHLFLEQTGVGLRSYVLWLRLEKALAEYVAGNSLTEAAYKSGFADSAHLSRTFKRMFGITPASVRPE
jgi:AraC-like DNA-binding protein